MRTPNLPGQLDITGTITDAQFTATPTRRRATRPGPNERPWWRTTKVQRDCEDCWDDQIHAERTGAQVPFRRHVTVRMITHETTRYLCSLHARQRGWNPAGPRRGGTR